MPTVQILGINFFNGTLSSLISSLKTGGLLVVPAAPALVTIQSDKKYYNSLLNADFVIPDSGYMVLLWNLLNRPTINKISGFKFLVTFLESLKGTSDTLFCINPNQSETTSNETYLTETLGTSAKIVSYIAPMYPKTGNVEDAVLLQEIEKVQPKYVLVNLGGGTQEKLGFYLRQNLSYKPAIICTGAAIAFLTGKQAKMPAWGDKLFLGWLFRCIDNPGLFVPRYLSAFKLAPILWQYRSKQYQYTN